MCGNLGLLLLTGELSASEALEAMARVTSMRGAQSFGFAASTPKRLRLYKAVVPKRVDVAVALKRAFQSRIRSSKRPLAVACHLRFATSSTTTRRDAHPHVWDAKKTSTVVTIHPQSLIFKAHQVSRATVVTHNGDFEAFDLGRCFGGNNKDKKVVSLERLRTWLHAHLGSPAPSKGDSIVAAGLLELLFTMGDPDASARLAVATLEVRDGQDVTTKTKRVATVRSVGAAIQRVLLRLSSSICCDLSVTLNGDLSSETRSRRMNRLSEAVAEELQSSLVDHGEAWVAAVAKETVRNFFEADLRGATRRFLRHARGSFGLVVASSLAPGILVVASVKQPMQVGLGPGFVAYASERAALHVGPLGEKLTARRLLKDGDVLWIAPASAQRTLSQETHQCGGGGAGGAADIAGASIHDDRPFRVLSQSSTLEDFDFDAVEGNPLMMPRLTNLGGKGDVVGRELAETPALLQKIRDSFRDPSSFNAKTAEAFADALFLLHTPSSSSQTTPRLLDLLIVGVEASLWVGEQWAANVRSVIPKLRVRVLSANKVLASLTAVAFDATCGAQTQGFTAFPSGTTPADAAKGAVALVVSHSGQTFPSLNAARALRRAGSRVFAVAGSQDTVIASDVLDQSFAPKAPHSTRLFSTEAGICLAEAASKSTAALHVLLTELLFAVAAKAPKTPSSLSLWPGAQNHGGGEDTGQKILAKSTLLPNDLADLRSLHDASVDVNVGLIIQGKKTNKSSSSSSPRDEAVAQGRRWGNHVAEPFLCFLAATAYVLATVTAGTPLVRSVVSAFYVSERLSYVVAAVDALLYAFFPVVCALALRVLQGRTLLARFGKRTVLVLDVPQVHQCVVAYAQKLFALSYGLNSVDVHGANPSDHAVHKVLHRTVRGTLVALGVPDGRLKALVDAECAAFLTASQIKSISHWGVGPEVVTVGHHSFVPAVVDGAVIFDAFERPKFLSEVAHALTKEDEQQQQPAKAKATQQQPLPKSAAKASSSSSSRPEAAAVRSLRRGSSLQLVLSSTAASSKKDLAQSRRRSATTPDARRIAFLTKPIDLEQQPDSLVTTKDIEAGDEPPASAAAAAAAENDDDDDSKAPSLLTKQTIIGAQRVATPKQNQQDVPMAEILSSHTIVETLYEGRVASLERQVGFYVLFHAVAKRASDAVWPLFHFDLARSQAGTRVATTPAPVSPAIADDAGPRVLAGVEIERVTTHDDFQKLDGSYYGDKHAKARSIFSGGGGGAATQWRTLDYDTLSVHTDDGSQGLDLSAYDAPAFTASPPRPPPRPLG